MNDGQFAHPVRLPRSGGGATPERTTAENSHSVLNTFIINISLPALTLAQIHGVHLQSTLAYSVAMPWAMF